MKKENPYKNFMETFGDDYIMQISIEELSELIKAICKFKRAGIDIDKDRKELVDSILEGIADFEICMEELAIIFDGFEKIEEIKQNKIKKGAERAEKFKLKNKGNK